MLWEWEKMDVGWLLIVWAPRVDLALFARFAGCVPKKYRSQWNGRKGHPNRTGLAARSPSAVKRELQKLTPCGCSDMMRPAEVPLGCNSFPFHGSLLAQFCNGVNSKGIDLDAILEHQKSKADLTPIFFLTPVFIWFEGNGRQ